MMGASQQLTAVAFEGGTPHLPSDLITKSLALESYLYKSC